MKWLYVNSFWKEDADSVSIVEMNTHKVFLTNSIHPKYSLTNIDFFEGRPANSFQQQFNQPVRQQYFQQQPVQQRVGDQQEINLESLL